MHAIGGFGNHTLVKQATASITQGEDLRKEPGQERISAVAQRLQAYALSMAADVDAHQTTVQAVNNTLIESDDASPELVIQAVGQLIEANELMQTQLQQAQDRIHEQAVQIESAERRAETDALTRVPNRRAFDNHFGKRQRLGASQAGTLALLDVDHFKQFNDLYGHRAGDEVLRIVANVLHTRLHSYGLVSRFGGEEFAVILDGCPIDQATQLIESARIAIGERDIQFEDKRLRVAASAGVAELIDGESIEDWLQRADDAMYRSKEAGRNCGHWMDGVNPVRIELADPEGTAESRRTFDGGNGAGGGLQGSSPMAGSGPQEQQATAETRSATTRNGQDAVTAAESHSGSGTVETAAAAKSASSAFAYLPDRETLGVSFAEIRGRTQASVSIFVAALVCDPSIGNAAMRSLLQIVRATMRSVDRIGCDDDSTLLICMPSVDAATASDRSRQICRSAEAIGLGVKPSGEHQVSVGIAEAGPEEDFSGVVSRAIGLARNCRSSDSNPVCLEGQEALVSG